MGVVNMAGNNITYRVTGRYMSGSNVVGYHIVGEDGSQNMANRDRILYLIGHGQIENMRIQFSDGEAIIRGRGVNLNTLPIYDLDKNGYRGNPASQSVAATNVTPKEPGAAMGQYTILKRIMAKNTCLGYIVSDSSGREMKIRKQKALELAHERLIRNAVVNRYKTTDGKIQIVLRGVGCDLNKIPVVAVDENGSLVDPTVIAQQPQVYMRAAKMARGGIIYDKKSNRRLGFASGDYILCGVNATLRPIKASEASGLFKIATDVNAAVCDEFLQNLTEYPIELFGSTATVLNASQVKSWPIVKVTRTRQSA